MEIEESGISSTQKEAVMESKEINNANKEKALTSAISVIEKQYGKGAIMRLGKEEVLQEIEAVPTGSLGLDLALGIGGLPRGRIIEIYGPESSGKTTLALTAVAQTQKKGGIAAFIDAEQPWTSNTPRSWA
jgi:recombination protein RecA